MSDVQYTDALGSPLRVGDRVATAGANRGALILGTVKGLRVSDTGALYYILIITDSGRKITRYGKGVDSDVVRVLTPESARQAAMDAEDAEWLGYLEAAGVDNWEGYDEARRLKREDKGEEGDE